MNTEPVYVISLEERERIIDAFRAEIAASLVAQIHAGADKAKVASSCCRQGDITLVRSREASGGGGGSPAGGWLIARGAHGDHRLIAPSGTATATELDLPDGGLLVHTDLPEARHPAIQLEPGCWQIRHAQELRAGQVVQVKD